MFRRLEKYCKLKYEMKPLSKCFNYEKFAFSLITAYLLKEMYFARATPSIVASV